MVVREPGRDTERYNAWKEQNFGSVIEGLSKINSDLIQQHLKKSEEKGDHFNTLNVKRHRLIKLFRQLESKGIKNALLLKESELYEILKSNSIDDLKCFTAFWHALMKAQKKLYLETKGKKGKVLNDICTEFNKKRVENIFVYFTFEDLKTMLPYFNEDEQVMLLFLFDTIMRAPKELMNIKVSDIHDDFKEVQIRDETSKTFGRTIKLLLCSKELKAYVKRKDLKPDDFLFNFDPSHFNRQLKATAKKVFGDKMTKGGEPYSHLNLYDFRHSGSIHWRLGGYQSKIDALMYRGGWSNLTILNYYTKKIGMADSIEKQDLLIGVDKNELERQIEEQRKLFEESEKEKQALTKKVEQMESQLNGVIGLARELRRNASKLKQIKEKKQ